MSTICWNARGLGNPQRVQVLKDLILTKRPKIVFLMETMVGGERMQFVRNYIGFAGSYVVDNVGNKRGVLHFLGKMIMLLGLRVLLLLTLMRLFLFRVLVRGDLWVSMASLREVVDVHLGTLFGF